MLGERIQQARKAAGLSLRGLAEKTGVTAMAISKYERNESVPSSKVLYHKNDVVILSIHVPSLQELFTSL